MERTREVHSSMQPPVHPCGAEAADLTVALACRSCMRLTEMALQSVVGLIGEQLSVQ